MEISWRWYRAAIFTKYETVVSDKIHTFVGSIGRMKLVTPIYSAYMAIG